MSCFKVELCVDANMYRSWKSIVNNMVINVTKDKNDNGILKCFLCASDYLSVLWILFNPYNVDVITHFTNKETKAQRY